MLEFKFSVLLPIYNRENPEFFRLSLDSLVNQTYSASEVVIVKDGVLTPALDQVIESFTDKLPLKIVPLEKNVGLGEALRIGILHCSYEYIARMDSDDICIPERFEKQVNTFLKNPGLDILGSYLQEFENTPGDINVIRKVPTEHSDIHTYTFYRCPFNHPTIMFRKSAVLGVGSYQKMPFFEDYFLWIRMANGNCVFQNLDEVLLHFRIGNDMIRRRHGLTYAKHEMSFFTYCYQQDMITLGQLLRFYTRFPIRLLPVPFLKKFYDIVLRK
ncbi:glycosyltransferase family 2 protein [Algoriphagus mannitolivorans]|uniref:glycosyltransferase family 2 protein n=1 Tax=Algoriphagus mannitolivorans TaxID=226504 RepID=UPI00042490A2|nr:glycosyltransferase [Algoriphagus mannitolivorans]